MAVDAGRIGDELVQKVVALIMRGHGSCTELLVFRHVLSGVRLPAGTIERGEAVEGALFREVREETGLARVRVLGNLALPDERLPPDELMVTERVVPLSGPRPGATPVLGAVRRGMGFACWEERGGLRPYRVLHPRNGGHDG